MSSTPPVPWIHIGECPVCTNGLCRIRTCIASDGSHHFYAMCDECESLWLQPSVDATRQFPDAEDPKCPICGRDMYNDQAHWSLPTEIQHTNWEANAIFETPTSVQPYDGESDVITPEDIVDNLDGPPLLYGEGDHASGSAASSAPSSRSDDNNRQGGNGNQPQDYGDYTPNAGYGDDDPKPGC